MGRLIEFPQADRPRSGRPLWRHVLGEVLRGERLDQERILTEVAQAAGVSPQYLSEVERGRKEASSEVLGAVAGALGLELADVVGRVAGRLGAVVPGRVVPDRLERERVLAERIVHDGIAHERREPLPPSAPTDAPSFSDVFLLAA
ncbi:helix-turn-helix domain-containing protein [Agromyces sp. ZXT2-6]|uniref:helix-turn-helix domain-containing protein n=1 Tax=Agromyces sp. ZXT2-6 TaxID=3461153 RepID=UPI004054E15A